MSVFKQPSKVERVGPDTRGKHHWRISHPAAKVLPSIGVVSGARWFADAAHGGSEGAKKEAERVLACWRSMFATEAKCGSCGAKHSPPGDQGPPDCPWPLPLAGFPGPPLTKDMFGSSPSNE